MGEPPELEPQAEEAEPASLDLEAAEADLENIPDWLLEEVEDADDAIFDDTSVVATQPLTANHEDDDTIDLTDPWAEAFELERAGITDLDDMPEWYAEKLRAEHAVSDLPDAELDAETELPAGELEAVPAWMGVAGTALDETETEVEDEEVVVEDEPLPDWLAGDDEEQDDDFVGEDLPDWLREAGIDDPDAVPDWLIEAIDDADEAAIPAPTPVEEPAAPAPTIIAPQPAAQLATDDITQTLQRAREKVSQHDVDGSLDDYEAVIRVSTQLAEVVEDLSALTKQDEHRNNPAVYRVLGDGLMRMGRLQDALDTYRRALNLL